MSLGSASNNPQIPLLISSWDTRKVITWRGAPGTSQRVTQLHRVYEIGHTINSFWVLESTWTFHYVAVTTVVNTLKERALAVAQW